MRKQFTGYERDTETDLDFAEARMHNFSLGRFTSPDLFAGKRSSPQTLNRYAYVRNNPLNLIDPSGLCGTTAGSLDNMPCIWLQHQDGRVLSVSEQQYGDGTGYDGFTRMTELERLNWRMPLTRLFDDYEGDPEYQEFLRNGTVVGLGSNGRVRCCPRGAG